jgi:hypothetical protein
MTSTASGFAVANNAIAGNSPTNYGVEWSAAVSDGVSQFFSIEGFFLYDTTQSVGANTCAFKASVAACALQETGLTIPVSNILVVMAVN